MALGFRVSGLIDFFPDFAVFFGCWWFTVSGLFSSSRFLLMTLAVSSYSSCDAHSTMPCRFRV